MPMSSKSEKIVDRLVESGRFASRTAVLEEAVHLLERREQFRDEVWKGIDEGIADAEAGRVMSAEEVRIALLNEFLIDD